MGTTSNSIVLKRMNSANVRLDNSGDSERSYDVVANVGIAESQVTQFNGEVTKDGKQMGSFSCYGNNGDNLSINYQNVPVAEQGAMLTAVQDFLAESRAFVASSTSLTSL